MRGRACVKRLLLAGGGQTHVLVLRELARRRSPDVDVVLVTASHSLPYSGMLPGWMAGHYSLDEMTIELMPLVRAARARLVLANVQAIDLVNKRAATDGETIEFDVLSIATGAVIDAGAIPGAREHALPLRPLGGFVAGWQTILQRAAAARGGFRLTVIGGGAGGAELALAAAYRARTLPSPMHVQLITGDVPLLPGHGMLARALMRKALRRHGVEIIDTLAVKVDANAVMTRDHSVPSDATLLVTGAAAAAWPRASGLEVESGFIAVDSHLQSTSHPFVFAAGDAAALVQTPRPKSGVYAVRAATSLAFNLIAALTAQPLTVFKPQRRALYLLTTGARHAIGSWGRWAFAGRWVWHWKNRIDRGYIAALKIQTPASFR